MDIDHLVSVSRLTDALSRATSLDDIYSAALDALERSLGVSRSSVLLFDEHDFCGFVAWRGISDEYRAAVNGHTPWRPDTNNPDPVCIADVGSDVSLANLIDVFRREGIRSLAFFPLNYRDRVLGKFMLYYGETHEFFPPKPSPDRSRSGSRASAPSRRRSASGCVSSSCSPTFRSWCGRRLALPAAISTSRS